MPCGNKWRYVKNVNPAMLTTFAKLLINVTVDICYLLASVSILYSYSRSYLFICFLVLLISLILLHKLFLIRIQLKIDNRYLDSPFDRYIFILYFDIKWWMIASSDKTPNIYTSINSFHQLIDT